ncbi:MAG: hypothetical protein U0W24_25495 [Bacteroidales bacterium]
MKTNLIKYIAIILVFLTGILSCKKEINNTAGPVLAFLTDSGFLYTDTILPSGDTALISVSCEWNGSNPLKVVNIYMNNNPVSDPIELVDSLGQNFSFVVKVTKTLVAKETWKFEAADAGGHISQIQLVIYNDNSGGNILNINGIIGAQLNPAIGSYYNIATGEDYMKEEAEITQELIDIVGGYEFSEKSFFSSPGSSNFFNAYDFSLWTNKNLTLFCLTNLSVEQFKLINKDNLLISSFHEDLAVDIISNLQPNEIYSFKTAGNKYGLVQIIEGAISESGFITFDVKIQE